MNTLFAPSRPSWRRVATTAVLSSAIAVALSRVLGSHNLAAATALCLLAVVVAAAVSGRRSGLVAALISFFGLNFFFTEPRHTLVVHKPSDLVALCVFLVSAVIVGTLLSRALEERDRAERRATEAKLLSDTSVLLISNGPFEKILTVLADALMELFELVRCDILTAAAGGHAGVPGPAAGPAVTIPLSANGTQVGSLAAERAAESELFSSSEVAILEALGSQIALAVERLLLDREVRSARVDAETSALRAALFSSVTHDLRTPLSSIKASATGLISPGADYSDAQREEMARTVIEEADHLNQIVGNLLDLARMRAGALLPSKQVIFLEDVVASTLRRMRRALEGVEVRTNIRPQVPPIDADPVQIEQVVSNLLENALRFSPTGSEIRISVAQWHRVVQARVSDHGPGIPAELRGRVFEEFFSRNSGEGRGGTGLGLAIARAVVIAHGGRIWIEGTPGGGTTVVFELPMSTGVPAGAAAGAQSG